jgi:NAD(P)H-dependent FMN reductase
MTALELDLPLRVAVVGLSPRIGSSWQACRTVQQLFRALEVEVECVTTAGLPVVPAGLDDILVPASVERVLTAVRRADATVLGVPVHRSAVAGVARNWVELLREGLADKPVLPIVSAGSARAQLAAEAFRADLWSNFSARPTRSVLVTPELAQDELVVRLGDAVVTLLEGVQPAAIPSTLSAGALA